MAFCIANAFICMCPHNPHIEDEPRESGISSDRILIQITIGESKTLFFLSQSHTHIHLASHNATFLPKCGCLSLWHFVIVIFVAILSCFFCSQPARFASLYLKSHLFLLSFYVLHFFIIFILLLSLHIHANWLEDSFFCALCSALFELLFLDYCSVILAVCGMIARISYNCMTLKHCCCHKTAAHAFAPSLFSTILTLCDKKKILKK